MEIEPEADPLLRLAALIEVDREGASALAARLRFSNVWRDRLRGLSPPWPLDPREDARAQRQALYRLGAERYRDLALLLAAERRMSRNRFAELHRAPGCFVMPNPFDIGSAKYLASLGFPAVASSSAGMAFAAGRPDQGVTRDYALKHIGELVVGHEAREIDLRAAVIEKNLAANGRWHQIAPL